MRMQISSVFHIILGKTPPKRTIKNCKRFVFWKPTCWIAKNNNKPDFNWPTPCSICIEWRHRKRRNKCAGDGNQGWASTSRYTTPLHFIYFSTNPGVENNLACISPRALTSDHRINKCSGYLRYIIGYSDFIIKLYNAAIVSVGIINSNILLQSSAVKQLVHKF